MSALCWGSRKQTHRLGGAKGLSIDHACEGMPTSIAFVKLRGAPSESALPSVCLAFPGPARTGTSLARPTLGHVCAIVDGGHTASNPKPYALGGKQTTKHRSHPPPKRLYPTSFACFLALSWCTLGKRGKPQALSNKGTLVQRVPLRYTPKRHPLHTLEALKKQKALFF
jgi:hypothetical protein